MQQSALRSSYPQLATYIVFSSYPFHTVRLSNLKEVHHEQQGRYKEKEGRTN